MGSWEPYLCPPGHYCDTITKDLPSPCPVGTYYNSYGNSASGNCLTCPDGFYCPSGATFPVACQSGYLCKQSSMTNKAVSTSVSCGAGKYSGGKGATTIADCRVCPAGYYCVDGSPFPTPCPAGKYLDTTGGTQLSDCKDSTAGFVQPWLGYVRAITPI